MRRILPQWLPAILLLAISCSSHAVPLRVASFNVEVGLGSPGSASFEDSAAVLQRIGADVVAMQELISDSSNLSAMSRRLGMPHAAYQSSTAMSVGLISRYPLSPPFWIYRGGMTRPILLVQVDVPGALRDPWIAVVHLKCCNDYGTEQYTRALELYFLRKEITQRVAPEDPVMIMGDFNLVAPTDVTYATGPDGVSPFPAPASADGYFITQGIFKMDARHAGTGGETWTWRSKGQFPNSALDHIMVNGAVRARGTAVEIYNAEKDAAGIAGLPKAGSPLAASLTNISDHLPVFADLDIDDGTPYSPGNFRMDGLADSLGYTLNSSGITLRVAVRGTRLYVATQSTANAGGGNDHHILIADTLLNGAITPAPWAKRGFTAQPPGQPFLAAEGVNDYAGWFDGGTPTGLRKWPNDAGVLEGSIDLVARFGRIPEFIYIAAVAYQSSDASQTNTSLGRVLSQVPAANVVDDNITPDEFLTIPIRSVADSAADGRFDVLVPGRGFAAEFVPPSPGFQPGVRWRTVPGRTYRLWRSTDLSIGSWQDAGTVLTGPAQWEAFVPEANDGASRRFFRIEFLQTLN